jgi:Amt family ammonium transporter
MKNNIKQNVADASIGGLFWYASGYGIAFGESPSRFMGTTMFFCTYDEFSDGTGINYALWFFQYCFAATASTIISGAVAERCTLTAYMIYTSVMSALIYPVVVQMAWGGNGKFSTFLWTLNPDVDPSEYLYGCGVIDFAGSGVVHMVGGVAALIGAIFVGPRRCFVNGTTTTPIYGPIFQVSKKWQTSPCIVFVFRIKP